MSDAPTWTGRCLCGAVRYTATGPPRHVALCHCDDCRRAGGGPFQGWVFFPREAFHLFAGEPRVHAYDGRERSFCAECGSPITFADRELPDLIEVALGTFDQAAELKPDDHHWMADRLPWVAVDPALPRFEHTGPLPCST